MRIVPILHHGHVTAKFLEQVDHFGDFLLRDQGHLQAEMSVLFFEFGLAVLRDQHDGGRDEGNQGHQTVE